MPGEFHGQREAWWAAVHGVAESDTTEHAELFCILVCSSQLLPYISASKTSEFSCLGERSSLRSQICPVLVPIISVCHVSPLPAWPSLTRQDSPGPAHRLLSDGASPRDCVRSREEREGWAGRSAWGLREGRRPQKVGAPEATRYRTSRFPLSLAKISPIH